MGGKRKKERKVRIRLTAMASTGFLRDTLGLSEEERRRGREIGFFYVRMSKARKEVKRGNAIYA